MGTRRLTRPQSVTGVFSSTQLARRPPKRTDRRSAFSTAGHRGPASLPGPCCGEVTQVGSKPGPGGLTQRLRRRWRQSRCVAPRLVGLPLRWRHHDCELGPSLTGISHSSTRVPSRRIQFARCRHRRDELKTGSAGYSGSRSCSMPYWWRDSHTVLSCKDRHTSPSPARQDSPKVRRAAHGAGYRTDFTGCVQATSRLAG